VFVVVIVIVVVVVLVLVLVLVDFVIDSVQKLLDTHSYVRVCFSLSYVI
jgi:hypothetical protein